MKNVFFFALIIGFIFACKKDPNATLVTSDSLSKNLTTLTTTFCPNGQAVDISSLPQAVQDYIVVTYPNVSIDKAETIEIDGITHFGVELNDETNLLLADDGTLLFAGLEEEEIDIPLDSLPQSIADYVEANYPGMIITESESVVEYGSSFLEVVLSNDTTLLFDDQGAYLCDGNGDNNDNDSDNDNDNDSGNDNDNDNDSGNDNDNQDGGNDNDDGREDSDHFQLPQLVQDWLAINYPSHTLIDADLDTLCDHTQVIEITLETSSMEKIRIAVSLTGDLIYTVSDIATTDLPAVITDAILNAYPGTILEDEAESRTSAAGTIQYEVELITTTGDEINLIVAADGSIICEL